MESLATNLAILMANDLITNRLVAYVVAKFTRIFTLWRAQLTEESIRSLTRPEREFYLIPVGSTPLLSAPPYFTVM